MKTLSMAAFGVLLISLPAYSTESRTTAAANLRDTKGSKVGQVVLDQTPNGVLVLARLTDLPPGTHGFHIHEKGKCEVPFESAGGHFNPTGTQHGFAVEPGPHAGDMPNIVVPESGTIEIDSFIRGLKLEGSNGVLDEDGAAIIVHAGADDYRTDPAGSAGARIACGILEKRTDPPSGSAGDVP